MKTVIFEIIYKTSDSTNEGSAGYESVCRYLLQKFFEGSEGYEDFGIPEGLNGGSGGERLFDASTEG